MPDGLTQTRLKELYAYDKLTGVFTSLVARGRVSKGYQTKGSINAAGYYRLRVDGELHYAHRLAWLYEYGVWPTGLIDHRNENKGDNRIDNLREATNAKNKQNVTRKPASSGVIGAIAKRDKFVSKIKVDGKSIHLGTFDTAEEAGRAYETARQNLHPFSNEASIVKSLLGA